MRAGLSSARSSNRNSGKGLALHGMAAAGEPGLAAALGQCAHPADEGLALGRRDHATGVEEIEQMARLHALVVGGQRQRLRSLEQHPAFLFRIPEMALERARVCDLEVEGRELALSL